MSQCCLSQKGKGAKGALCFPPLQTRCNGSSERWSGRLDSNQRPPAPKAGALPGCATPRLCDQLFQFVCNSANARQLRAATVAKADVEENGLGGVSPSRRGRR